MRAACSLAGWRCSDERPAVGRMAWPDCAEHLFLHPVRDVDRTFEGEEVSTEDPTRRADLFAQLMQPWGIRRKLPWMGTYRGYPVRVASEQYKNNAVLTITADRGNDYDFPFTSD